MNTQHLKNDRYQRGAETVEFMITLTLFMFVVFMIIEFAILVYDRGTVNNAAREGSRQASLYWVDPSCFDPTKPLENQRMKVAMVTSVMDWTDANVLIDPGNAGLGTTVQINAADIVLDSSCSNGIDDVIVTEPDSVSVNLNYPHQFVALTGFVSSSAPTWNTFSAAGME